MRYGSTVKILVNDLTSRMYTRLPQLDRSSRLLRRACAMQLGRLWPESVMKIGFDARRPLEESFILRLEYA